MVAVDNRNEFEAEVPEELQPRFREIAGIVDQFCQERLDGEYREICRRILACYCQPGTNIDRGKAASWAAGVVYEAGQVNFLTDPQFEPHCKSDEIAKGCGVSVATMYNKGRDIREALRLMRLDPAFTTRARLEENPLAWMMELPNGMVVSLKDLPEELRQKLDDAGLLPDDADRPAEGDWRGRKLTPPRSPESGLLYTMKITLSGSKPPIWRRVEVPDCTLDQLHYVIQYAMGWDNSHLHEFVVNDQRFQPTASGFAVDAMWNMGMDETVSTEDTLLSNIIPETLAQPFRFRYLYDFGDNWDHAIVVERVEVPGEARTVPVCLTGKRACPPEDCGGIWGYEALLETIKDPQNPEYREMIEWAGELDPEAFDPEEANQIFRTWCRRASRR